MTFSPLRHILVVDDEQFVRKLLSDLLTDVDYQVDTAEDGAAGWEKLQSRNYDLLVTDNQMPKVTGVELVRKIRTAQMTLPIIMVTATPPEDIEELQLAAVLEKPFGIKQLARAVEEVFHQQSQIRDASKLKKIARQLLAAETAAVQSSGKDLPEVFPVYDKLRGPLSRLIGAVGLHSLMTRALTQANGEIHQLDGVQVNADGCLEGLGQLELRTVAASEAMLVSHLLGLLVTLIGPSLTLQLLHDTWPNLEDLNL
ncbi:MAG TPA: response regulator [Candidatus Sulfotelmatobacter sp.]|jgi:CheY-like chemotaxis protein|nr:response regulator [Candidatus Sulfotelmatobacter sp.]